MHNQIKINIENKKSLKNIYHPSVDSYYWCVRVDSEVFVERFNWSNSYWDNMNYQFGNCFKTEELATKAAKKIVNVLLNIK